MARRKQQQQQKRFSDRRTIAILMKYTINNSWQSKRIYAIFLQQFIRVIQRHSHIVIKLQSRGLDTPHTANVQYRASNLNADEFTSCVEVDNCSLRVKMKMTTKNTMDNINKGNVRYGEE